jgi:amino acid adenylation domain-containing protein
MDGTMNRALEIARRRSNLSPEQQHVLASRLRGERTLGPVKDKIPRRSDRGPAPLSFAQQRIWFLDQLVPGNPFYCQSSAIRFSAPLNVQALEWSLNVIVQRHESLRTTFSALDGQPVQVIAPALFVPLALVDLHAMSKDDREAEARRLATEDARRSFDLARGPLVRATLLQLDEEDYVFLLALHHIVCDGWSLQVLFSELGTLYAAFCTGEPSPLPELPIQYADFAVWQRQWLKGEVVGEQLAYWKQHLARLPVLQLPSDRVRPPVPTFEGGHHTEVLPTALSTRLQALCQQEGVTLFMMVLAAFQVLLHRYSGQTDIVVGSPVANRRRGEVEGLIGFFVNTLVMRTDLSGDPSFRDVLGRVREVALEAYAHQDLPFEKLVEELQPERDLSRNPLYQVALQLFNNQDDRREPSDGLPTYLAVETRIAKLDLRFDVWETNEGLMLQIEYSSDLFDAPTIARMGGHFATLLEGVVANPDERVSKLPLLTDAERRQLLVEWNGAAGAEPVALCIHQLFETHATRTPDAIAVTFGEAQLTYGELNRRANQLAHYLRSLGVGPERLVGLCLERSLDTMIGVLGVLKSGGAYVPIDPTYPRDRLAFMIADSRVDVLLTHERLLDLFSGHRATVACLDSDWEMIARHSVENPTSGVTADNIAYVIYTSGSSGRPKSVLVPHRGACNVAEVEHRELDVKPTDCILQFASLSFDASMCEFLIAARAGAALCLARHHSLLPGPALVRLLRDQQISAVLLPPSALAALPVDDLPALRTIAVEGEAFSADLVERWANAGRRFFNLYGPTETTIFTTMAECVDGTRRPHIGRPIANTRVYVLDRSLEPVPIGVPGELHIGGIGVSRGYLNRPELTAERFIPDPFGDGGRLYKTGDLVRYRSDGSLEFLGRVDHQVKVRGFRIEPGEIESALMQHPDVRDAVALAREDVPGDKRLVAYVVCAPGTTPTTTELRQFLQLRLPEFTIPSMFLLLDALPLMPNGKVDRAALPPPDKARPAVTPSYVAPHSELEKALTVIWQELLGLEKVGILDNFFDLGGHSLLIVRLQSRLEALLNVPVSVVDLFRHPTISALANFFADGQSKSVPLADPHDRAEKQRQARARRHKRMNEGLEAHD